MSWINWLFFIPAVEKCSTCKDLWVFLVCRCLLKDIYDDAREIIEWYKQYFMHTIGVE